MMIQLLAYCDFVDAFHATHSGRFEQCQLCCDPVCLGAVSAMPDGATNLRGWKDNPRQGRLEWIRIFCNTSTTRVKKMIPLPKNLAFDAFIGENHEKPWP